MNRPDVERAPGEIWRYGPASDYEAPRSASTEKVSSGLRAAFARFWGANPRDADSEDRAEFAPLSPPVLTEVMPDSSWSTGTAALASALDSWLHDVRPPRTCAAIIGPPGSGVGKVVTRWAAQKSARVLTAPPQGDILSLKPDWWTTADPDPVGFLVIPEFERFYLRHHEGLDLVRRLIERLWVAPRRLVIGCDSWAWAFLSKAVQLDAVFAPPISLMPLDADALRAWFRPRPRGRYLVQTVRGDHVLYPCEDAETAIAKPEGAAEGDEKPLAAGAEVFQRIAATSRGIPEVAMALWRKTLCVGGAEADPAEVGATRSVRPTAIRVRPPQHLSLPTLSSGSTTRDAVVLHTLLLHAGLPAEVLFRIVPFPAPVVVAILSALQAAELVREDAGLWRVTPLGYPAARAYLRAEGLLVDAF